MKLFLNFLLTFLILGISNLFGQYQMVLKNDTALTNSIYEFDIFVKSDSGSIDLTSYQIVLTYNDSVANGGNLAFSYINGSSQLTNIPDVNVGILNDGEIKNLVAGSFHGDDTISTDFIRLGRFRISDSAPFIDTTFDIKWDFDGLIRTEVNISDTNKTDSLNHINQLNNLPVYTGVIVDNNVPSGFKLYQNYPNPFNPTTTIEYSIPKASRVSLIIYNILGQVVENLVNNEYMNAGYHKISFNGSRFASGTYIYRLQAGNLVQVKKMMLLK